MECSLIDIRWKCSPQHFFMCKCAEPDRHYWLMLLTMATIFNYPVRWGKLNLHFGSGRWVLDSSDLLKTLSYRRRPVSKFSKQLIPLKKLGPAFAGETMWRFLEVSNIDPIALAGLPGHFLPASPTSASVHLKRISRKLISVRPEPVERLIGPQ